MFKDDARKQVFDQLRDHDLRVFAQQLSFEVFAEAAKRAGVRIWTCPLNLANLVWLGISAAWRKGHSFATILTVTLKLLQDQEHFAQSSFGKKLNQSKLRHAASNRKKYDPHGSDPTQVTEEAFAKARQRMPMAFWVELIVVLGERFESQHRDRLCFRGFRLLALDGTRLTLPDEKALREFYGTAKNGKGTHNAQARMVLLQSALTRFPIAACANRRNHHGAAVVVSFACQRFAPARFGSLPARPDEPAGVRSNRPTDGARTPTTDPSFQAGG